MVQHMRTLVLLIGIFLHFNSTVAGQFILNFEETQSGDTLFSAGGFEWILTGDFMCGAYEDFACDDATGLNRYMDSGWEDGGSEGWMGSFQPFLDDVEFVLSTADATLCIWPASIDGLFPGSGTVAFRGVQTNGNIIEEIFELATENYTLNPLYFSPEIWEDQLLSALEIHILPSDGDLDHLVIDNLSLAGAQWSTFINEPEALILSPYPVPTADNLHLGGTVQKVSIMDLEGRQLLQFDGPREQINLAPLTGGMYVLHAQHGHRTEIHRIIKE